MSEQRYSPEQIAQVNKAVTAHQEQVIKVKAGHEYDLKYMNELKEEIKNEFNVSSLDELRQLAQSEQSEINKVVAATIEAVNSGKAILDHLASQQSDKV